MQQQEEHPNRVTSATPVPADVDLLVGDRPRGFSIVNTLIAVNVGIFIIERLIRRPGYDPIYGLGALQTLAVAHGQYWRLLTAQYLHASVMHVGLNMLALYVLGRPLERLYSPRKFFVVYTICGLAGNLFFTVLGSRGVIDPRQAAVGASGCIYGLLGIVAMLFPTAELLIYGIIPIKVRNAAIIMGAIAFMAVVERGSNYGGEACHLAGLAFGVWWASHGDEWWSHSEWAWSRKRPTDPAPDE